MQQDLAQATRMCFKKPPQTIGSFCGTMPLPCGFNDVKTQRRKIPVTLKAYTDPFLTPVLQRKPASIRGPARHSAEWLAASEAQLSILRDKLVKLLAG